MPKREALKTENHPKNALRKPLGRLLGRYGAPRGLGPKCCCMFAHFGPHRTGAGRSLGGLWRLLERLVALLGVFSGVSGPVLKVIGEEP